jgi:hypothetical protein
MRGKVFKHRVRNYAQKSALKRTAMAFFFGARILQCRSFSFYPTSVLFPTKAAQYT